MRRARACWTRPEQRPLPATAFAQGGGSSGRSSSSSKACRPSRRKPGPGTPWSLLLALLAFGVSSCKGIPVASHVLQGEKMWNETDDMCSAYLARDTLPQLSNVLGEFCFMILEFLQKDKELVERGNAKKSLFHYFKIHHTESSNDLPSVMHPLLRLIPQLHERRQKRYNVDEELRIPGGVQSRGYFMFRPRNGRRSATFY